MSNITYFSALTVLQLFMFKSVYTVHSLAFFSLLFLYSSLTILLLTRVLWLLHFNGATWQEQA